VSNTDTSNEQLAGELESLKSNSATTSTEAQSLQAHITKLETSNRDTLSLLDSKSTAYDKLAEELTAQHKKTVNLRREISTLEEKAQTADNTVSNAKFRESALQSEVELLKRNNDWLSLELKAKAEEHTKSRKEKNARINELQRLNEDAAQEIEGLQRTEQTLRKRLEEVGQKADEAFTRIQQVQEDASSREESFRLELDSSKRLVDLQKQSADTARRRVQELEETLEKTRDDAAEEISQGLSEIETERQGRQTAEQKLEELEEELEQLRTAQAASEAQSPQTPRGINDFAASFVGSARGGSPAPFTPSGGRRGGLNYTQLYTDFNNIKVELETEKRRSEKLATTLDDMIRELEQKAPEAQESEMEHERLRSENGELANMLALARQEKDAARKDARRFQSQIEAFKRETDLLKQQLRDLSAQIKVLLVEVQIRENGVELSATERLQLQQAATGELDVDALEGMSDTARFISQRLISFKNIFELQEKNAELTRIVRDIGEQQEAAEATSQKLQQTEQERDAAAERLERYKDEMKSMVAQSQSYIRERDMFRRMLAHRGQLPVDGDLESMFGASVNGPGTPRTPHTNRRPDGDQTPGSKEVADLTKLLKEYQSQFDAYRQETGTNMTTIKDQNVALSKDKSHLQGDVARISSQLTLAHERYGMLQTNLEQLQSENVQLRGRAQSVMESAAKQDLKTQQVAEELVEARSQTESMRNENANLKAEKDLAKRIEARLQEDNKFLQEERSRLSTSLTEAQRMFNERELTDAELKRKVQAQVDFLEGELRNTKQKLDNELEFNKSAALRRDYESEQSRARIDDLTKMVSNVKEELIAAKTVRDQFQARIDELKIELRSAEERAQALQPRPTPRPTAGNVGDSDATTLAREQELSLEIADLHKELDLARNELENAHAQVEQYKAIAQSSEEELQALNETNDQFKEEMDKVVAEKEAKISDLEQRLQDISSELNTTNTQLSELRSSSQDAQSRLDQQRTAFEAELSQVKDEAEKHKEAATFHQEDLKAQAEIAQQAQQSYENELVKHGETTKHMHSSRAELNQLKLEVSQYKADAEAARATLNQSEESWISTKERYEKEFTEIKSRRDDIAAQNKVLHEQLENFSKQISALQNKRSDAENQAVAFTSTDSGMQNLQEVIKYLRGEKEMVDVKLELETQQTRRLTQTLDYTKSQLEEAQSKLEQEHQKQSDKERSAFNHSKLLDTINELNVFRESNVTLRNQLHQVEAQLNDKTKQTEELISQLQPLQTTLRELESEKETTQGELKLLEEDRDRWQQRTQNILQKYDRIDPAELEGLKEQITQLQTERDELTSAKQTLQEQIDTTPEELRKAKEEAKTEVRNKLAEQFKARSRELSSKIQEANAAAKTAKEQHEAATAELASITTERDAARNELEAANAARDEALAQVETLKAQPTADKTQVSEPDPNGVEEGQVVENGAIEQDSGLQIKLQDAEERAKDATDKAQTAQSELEAQRTRITELESRVNELEQQLYTANAELIKLQEQEPQTIENGQSDYLEKVKQELAAVQREVEAMRQTSTAANTAPTGDNSSLVAAQVEAQVAQIKVELEADHDAKVKAAEDKFNARADNMKTQLSRKLHEGRAAWKQEQEETATKVKQEHDSALHELKQEHEKEISSLKQQHAQEIEALKAAATTITPPVQETPAIPTPSSTVAPATENAFNQDSTIKVKAEEVADADNWTLPQAQAFIANNTPLKQIMVKNIRSKLDAEIAKFKEQHQNEQQQPSLDLDEKLQEARQEAEARLAEKLEEARSQADKTKEQAVLMEGKKHTLKNNLLEGRVKMANAKLDYVKGVATETPQRPVGEVWNIAKDVKPQAAPVNTSAAAPPAATMQSPRPQTPHTRRASTVQNPTPAAPTSTATPNTVEARSSPAPSSAPQSSAPATPQTGTTALPSQAAVGLGARPPLATGPAALRGALGQGTGIPRGGANMRGMGRGGRGGIPVPHDPNANATAQNAGSGIPGAPQDPRTRRGLPVPRGNPGMRGVGRGGRLSIGGNGNGNVEVGSPGGEQHGNGGRGGGSVGAMNPRAGGFVPGAGVPVKRPAGDSAGGDGKRIRGGGGPGGGGE